MSWARWMAGVAVTWSSGAAFSWAASPPGRAAGATAGAAAGADRRPRPPNRSSRKRVRTCIGETPFGGRWRWCRARSPPPTQGAPRRGHAPAWRPRRASRIIAGRRGGHLEHDPANDITALLAALRRGERAAMDELMPLVYDELRRRAHRQLSRRGSRRPPTA